MPNKLASQGATDLRLFSSYDLWRQCEEPTSRSGRLILYMSIFDECLDAYGSRYGVELTNRDSAYTVQWKAKKLALFLLYAHSTPPLGTTPRPFTFDALHHDSLMLVLAMDNVDHDELIEPGILIRAKELIEYIFELCKLDGNFLHRFHHQQ